MSTNLPEYNRGVVRPVECLKAGWELIKDQYWLFMGIIIVGLLIGGAVPLGILMGPMMCGIYLCLLRRLRGEPVTFELLFKGFDYFGESLIAALIQVVPIFVMMIIMYIVFFIGIMSSAALSQNRRGEPPDPTAFFAFFGVMMVVFFVFLLLIMLISSFFVFSYLLIVDRKLSGLDAIKTSFNAVKANFGGVAGLMLLNMALTFAGMLLCYIGALFVMPIGFAAWAIAYRQVFRTSDGAAI
ncbi:MAG TPA: hypothetical protein VGB17_18755 [Pyrinomonadaceae bacterium]|jgi:uncharacterized membrane protein